MPSIPRLIRSEVVRHYLLAPFDVSGHVHSVSVNRSDRDLFQNLDACIAKAAAFVQNSEVKGRPADWDGLWVFRAFS
jgi:hypothetical protein